MSARHHTTKPQTGGCYPSLADFERCQIDADAFSHAAHVFVAWELVNQCPLNDAIRRFTTALRRLTKAFNMESKYHETISWFFVILIAERQSVLGTADWNEFAAANADLLTDGKSLLERYYSAERLWSPLARHRFLLPDCRRTNDTRCR